MSYQASDKGQYRQDDSDVSRTWESSVPLSPINIPIHNNEVVQEVQPVQTTDDLFQLGFPCVESDSHQQQIPTTTICPEGLGSLALPPNVPVLSQREKALGVKRHGEPQHYGQEKRVYAGPGSEEHLRTNIVQADDDCQLFPDSSGTLEGKIPDKDLIDGVSDDFLNYFFAKDGTLPSIDIDTVVGNISEPDANQADQWLDMAGTEISGGFETITKNYPEACQDTTQTFTDPPTEATVTPTFQSTGSETSTSQTYTIPPTPAPIPTVVTEHNPVNVPTETVTMATTITSDPSITNPVGTTRLPLSTPQMSLKPLPENSTQVFILAPMMLVYPQQPEINLPVKCDPIPSKYNTVSTKQAQANSRKRCHEPDIAVSPRAGKRSRGTSTCSAASSAPSSDGTRFMDSQRSSSNGPATQHAIDNCYAEQQQKRLREAKARVANFLENKNITGFFNIQRLGKDDLGKLTTLLYRYLYHGTKAKEVKGIYSQRPANWPQNVHFGDPNNNKRGLKKPTITETLEMCEHLYQLWTTGRVPCAE